MNLVLVSFYLPVLGIEPKTFFLIMSGKHYTTELYDQLQTL